MKSFESVPSETAIRRLVLARVVAGIIVLIAVVLAPPVADTIARADSGVFAGLGSDDGDGGNKEKRGIEAVDTMAIPVEPLSMSY